MRRLLSLTLLAVFSVLAAAAYSRARVVDHMTYANNTSRAFAAGDNGYTSGWRECSEIPDTPPFVGVVCDGRRVMQVHGGQMVDVNYFCEFQFKRVGNSNFRVMYSLCQ